jgi:hypothetical protein
MKFKLGDATDSEHCTALKHEFLRCEDAFKDFETYGTLMIIKAQDEAQGKRSATPHEKRFIAYKTYNAYSRFIHHLYEFMLGAVARETGNSRKIGSRRCRASYHGARAEHLDRQTSSDTKRHSASVGKRYQLLSGKSSGRICKGVPGVKEHWWTCFAQTTEPQSF